MGIHSYDMTIEAKSDYDKKLTLVWFSWRTYDKHLLRNTIHAILFHTRLHISIIDLCWPVQNGKTPMPLWIGLLRIFIINSKVESKREETFVFHSVIAWRLFFSQNHTKHARLRSLHEFSAKKKSVALKFSLECPYFFVYCLSSSSTLFCQNHLPTIHSSEIVRFFFFIF